MSSDSEMCQKLIEITMELHREDIPSGHEFKLKITDDMFFSIFILSPQVEIWPTQPYLGIPRTFPPRAKAATRPPRLLEWFLVSERQHHCFILSLRPA